MANSNFFIIEVSGDPGTGIDIERLKRKLHRSVMRVDPDVKLEETTFMRMSYRFTWTGVPVHVEKIDDAWNEIGKKIRVTLSNWYYRVVLNYIETEG